MMPTKIIFLLIWVALTFQHFSITTETYPYLSLVLYYLVFLALVLKYNAISFAKAICFLLLLFAVNLLSFAVSFDVVSLPPGKYFFSLLNFVLCFLPLFFVSALDFRPSIQFLFSLRRFLIYYIYFLFASAALQFAFLSLNIQQSTSLFGSFVYDRALQADGIGNQFFSARISLYYSEPSFAGLLLIILFISSFSVNRRLLLLDQCSLSEASRYNLFLNFSVLPLLLLIGSRLAILLYFVFVFVFVLSILASRIKVSRFVARLVLALLIVLAFLSINLITNFEQLSWLIAVDDNFSNSDSRRLLLPLTAIANSFVQSPSFLFLPFPFGSIEYIYCFYAKACAVTLSAPGFAMVLFTGIYGFMFFVVFLKHYSSFGLHPSVIITFSATLLFTDSLLLPPFSFVIFLAFFFAKSSNYVLPRY